MLPRRSRGIVGLTCGAGFAGQGMLVFCHCPPVLTEAPPLCPCSSFRATVPFAKKPTQLCKKSFSKRFVIGVPPPHRSGAGLRKAPFTSNLLAILMCLPKSYHPNFRIEERDGTRSPDLDNHHTCHFSRRPAATRMSRGSNTGNMTTIQTTTAVSTHGIPWKFSKQYAKG